MYQKLDRKGGDRRNRKKKKRTNRDNHRMCNVLKFETYMDKNCVVFLY